ncbi:MAG: hypothetical protein A2Y41_05915 [Spirochaetes bacterium GWB1_36_13]|nr:MAG: hypothetical protein A2Y41_05915 [Spirochaetes bacterium GWB1_36_13]
MKILILGGAGFIGSNIAKLFVEQDYKVTIIDGILKNTGGNKINLKAIEKKINFIPKRIEEICNLEEILDSHDLIIDCMAWTSHKAALENPLYDIELNIASHVYYLNKIKSDAKTKIIYLGSRGQYGNPSVKEITEETYMVPEDVQGINKLAAEQYFRLYAKLKNLNIASIRFPNCFGENQPYQSDDIGLIGGFVRDLFQNKKIEVYGDARKRYIVYVKDLAKLLINIAKTDIKGFQAFNFSGYQITIEELVVNLIKIIGKGSYEKKELPPEIKAIDIGDALFNDEKIKEIVKEFKLTNLSIALEKTISYFKEKL